MPSASSERREGSLRRRPPLRVVVAGQALAEAVGLGAGEETVHCRVASALVRALRGEKEYGSGSPSLVLFVCGSVMGIGGYIYK